MSQFIDGYFAESYFDEMASVAELQAEIFCSEISKLLPEKVRRLKGIQQSNCN